MWNQKKQDRCSKLKRQRNSLYSKRAYLQKKLKSGKLSEKQSKSTGKRITKLTAQIDSFRSKIFKCGKKFHQLTVERTRLLRANKYLRDKIKSGKFNTTEKNRFRSMIGKNNDMIRDIDVLRGKDYKVVKGKIEVIRDDANKFFQERVPIWDLRGDVTPSLSSRDYDYLFIEGDRYSLGGQTVDILFAIDDYVEYVHNSQYQRQTKTPMIWLTLDGVERVITISLEQI